MLLTSGVVFESIPVSIVLPGNILNQSVVLTGVPKEVGELEIKGNVPIRRKASVRGQVFTIHNSFRIFYSYLGSKI